MLIINRHIFRLVIFLSIALSFSVFQYPALTYLRLFHHTHLFMHSHRIAFDIVNLDHFNIEDHLEAFRLSL